MFKMRDSVPSARYSPICNVLHQWKTSLIPIYRVYRLYDMYALSFHCRINYLQNQGEKFHVLYHFVESLGSCSADSELILRRLLKKVHFFTYMHICMISAAYSDIDAVIFINFKCHRRSAFI